MRFLRYIRRWGKKVVFLLNKVDILADGGEVAEARPRPPRAARARAERMRWTLGWADARTCKDRRPAKHRARLCAVLTRQTCVRSTGDGAVSSAALLRGARCRRPGHPRCSAARQGL